MIIVMTEGALDTDRIKRVLAVLNQTEAPEIISELCPESRQELHMAFHIGLININDNGDLIFEEALAVAAGIGAVN